MKKNFSLRMQFVFLMGLLAVFQMVSLIMALYVSRVFFLLDSEAIRVFDNTINTRTLDINQTAGKVVGDVTEEAAAFNLDLNKLAQQSGVTASRIYQDDALYNQVVAAGSQSLIRLLQSNNITGAFFILNRSNASKNQADAHSAVYIRNLMPDHPSENIGNYQLEIGSIRVSQQYRIATGINWDLDMRLDEEDYFYHRPIEASIRHPELEFQYLGYWSAPTTLLQNNQSVICYTIPMLDEYGTAFGVFGIEISLVHFAESYLPNTDFPYQNSFYAIAPQEEQGLSFEWFIPGGSLAQVYLPTGVQIPFEPAYGSALYKMPLSGLGDMYYAMHPLKMYSDSSPFVQEAWSLTGFVPQAVLNKSSTQVRTLLMASIMLTTLISFVAIFFLAHISTCKISGLSAYVKGMTPTLEIKFIKTGLREIDDLTLAIEIMNRQVLNAFHNTEKAIELTGLPFGVFEMSKEVPTVSLTSYVYKLLKLEPGLVVGCREWETLYSELRACPEPGDECIYHYRDKWLRILEASADNGMVGIIFDVTNDMEAKHRLQRELDYDALTMLFNRRSFKREVQKLICSQPERLGAMIFSDLDNLKYVNDTYGHDMGDRLIVQAGEMFRAFSKDGGIVARISGDEFAVYLHGFLSKDELRGVINKQFKEHEKYVLETSDHAKYRIRASSGIAWYPQDSYTAADLLKLADFAMYQAKKMEKGSLREFDVKTYKEISYLLENREAINHLLDEQLIRFALQPIVDIRTGEIYAYEALMRPLLDNFKSPQEILTVAADQSKLGQLERLVWLLAFQMIEEHQEEIGSRKIFINSIANQMLSGEDRLYLQRQYAPFFKQVVIEITETESNHANILDEKLSFIRKCGMMLAIDDFGSGYSNNSRVFSMNPDIIKIDMGMIQGIHDNHDQQELMEYLVSYSRQKQILLVAEGVETLADLKELMYLDVALVQGYYTGKPEFTFSKLDDSVKMEICGLYKNFPVHQTIEMVKR